MNKYYCVTQIGSQMGCFMGNTEVLNEERLLDWRKELAEMNDVRLSKVLIVNITKLDE